LFDLASYVRSHEVRAVAVLFVLLIAVVHVYSV
jgi:hypothetical protein